MYSTLYSLRILNKLEFSLQVFKKYSITKFRENSSNGSQIILYGQTDKRVKANSPISQFCERALKSTEKLSVCSMVQLIGICNHALIMIILIMCIIIHNNTNLG
jgi:hypothetical protein